MKAKILLTLMVVLFFQLSINAQESANGQEKYKHFLGLAAGFTTGYGVSYRYVPDKFGVQITLAPYYSKNDNSTVSAGITLLQKIKEANDHRLLLYFSNSVFYRKTFNAGYYSTIYPPTYYPASSSSTSSYNTGVGLDLQFFNNESPFVFDLMTGFGSFDSFKIITFTGEVGLYYKL